MEKDSFIDEDDKKYSADLLFSVRLQTNDEAFVYILFEHKSYSDNRVLLQLLGYMVNIWKEQYRNNKKKKLPRIIPVIVYHGKNRWYIPQMLSDMFNPMEELGQFLPDFEAKVVNLKVEKLKGSSELKLFLWALKYAFNKNPIENLIEIKELFLLSMKEKSFEFDLVLTYLAKLEKLSYEETFRKIGNTLNIGVNEMELMSEYFKKKGRQEGILLGVDKGIKKGIAKGKLEGRVESIRVALKSKFGKRGLLLIDKIRQIDEPKELDKILSKIIMASSLNDIV